MRKQIIDDRELLKILNEKAKLQKEIDKKIDKFKNLTAKTDQLQEAINALKEEFKTEYEKVEADVKQIDEEMKPYLTKTQRYKDKINPILKKHKIELGEFEMIQSTELENGKVVVSIIDLVEEYKKQLKDKINDKRGDTTNTGEKKV